MSGRPDAVVFDLGNVLIAWDPRHLYRRHFDDEDEMERFLATVCTPDFNDELDRGRPFADAVAELSERHPQHAHLIRLYHERWDDMFPGPLDDSVAVLDELRSRRVRLYALTNWSAETFPRAREAYPFLSWFDGIVVSGEVGHTKPAPEIFQALCERHGVEPSRAVFIDDVDANVEGARAFGFDAILFTDATSLRGALAERGLL